MRTIKIYFDGGSKPNALTKFSQQWHGYGSYEIESGDGLNFKMEREQFGPMTCNQAEYTALIKALAWLVPKLDTHLQHRIHIFTDSKLVANQVPGKWKIKKQTLKALCENTRQLLSDSKSEWDICWRGRIHNVRRFGH